MGMQARFEVARGTPALVNMNDLAHLKALTRWLLHR